MQSKSVYEYQTERSTDEYSAPCCKFIESIGDITMSGFYQRGSENNPIVTFTMNILIKHSVGYEKTLPITQTDLIQQERALFVFRQEFYEQRKPCK